MTIDPSNLTSTANMTFSDNFNQLNAWNGLAGLDTTGGPQWSRYGQVSSLGTMPYNNELEFYVSEDSPNNPLPNPFSVNNGILSITAQAATTNDQSLLQGHSYTSGMISTFHEFSQTYGYFEMRAELPTGSNVWPAFWLLPTNGNWPPELDIQESFGDQPGIQYMTAHTSDSAYTQAGPNHYVEQGSAYVSGMTTGFHTYGLDWEPDYLTWYVDGHEVFQAPTPSDMNTPMYMIANLAMMSGIANPATSATMEIDYIRAYSALTTNLTVYSTSSSTLSSVSLGTATQSHASDLGAYIHDASSAGGEVYAMYEGLLGRAPDPIGFEDMTSHLQSGMSLHDLAQAMLSSAEHTQNFGAYDQLTDTAFVTQLYQVVQGRAPDASGLTHWEQALANGESRADVGVSFALSAEHIGDLQASYTAGVFDPDKGAADVARLYYGIQGRAPDAGGLAHFVTALANGESVQDVAKDFLASSEYQSKLGGLSDAQFVDALYQNALGRHAEADGLDHFVSAIQNGTTRAEVAYDIAESPEAHQHLMPAIEQGWVLA